MAIVPYSIGEAAANMNVNEPIPPLKPSPSVSFDIDEEESALDNLSSADQPIDYSELVKDSTFIGQYPYETIIEGLEEQFADYINLEDDNTNYVDVFYDQLHASFEAINTDEEEHPQEKKMVLQNLQDKFIEKMAMLFEQRLTITFVDIDGGMSNYDDIEFVLRRSYEFFILGARNNFLTVMAADIYPKVKDIENDREYFNTVNDLVDSHSPLITSFGPIEFLKYRNDREMIELFENGKIVGNFLRKYSAKLYNNETFRIDIVNHITAYQQFMGDLNDSVNS